MTCNFDCTSTTTTTTTMGAPMACASGVGILKPSFYNSPIPENSIRFVCFSDTHSKVERTDYITHIPDGDVLLHAGDFTCSGRISQLKAFNQFLDLLPHRIKLAVPGNHEVTLDPRGLAHHPDSLRQKLNLPPECENKLFEENYKDIVKGLVDLVPNATILRDAWVSICGIKIYGYPWVPLHGLPGFGLSRSATKREKQALIPSNTDILLSHGPVAGYGDQIKSGRHVGCDLLKKTLADRVKPRVVVCGHIHEAHGVYADEETVYINAAVCNCAYKPVHVPYVFDYALPSGYTRDDFRQLHQSMLTVHSCDLR